jgi:hypothetical protein
LKDEQSEHRRRFERDARVRRRRAMRITRSLKAIDKLGFARFFVDCDDPTLAAIIAWREFEINARSLLYNTGERSAYTHDLKMDAILRRLPKGEKTDYEFIWRERNSVMHHDRQIEDRDQARKIVQEFANFIEKYQRQIGLY